MSVVYITHHNESIYASTKITTEVDRKPTFYVSKFNRSKRLLSSSKDEERKKNGIMGKPKQPPPDPLHYLKKNTYKIPVIPITQEERDYMQKKYVRKMQIPVPKTRAVVKEQEEKIRHVPKKFIIKNVQNVLRMKPKEPETNVVLDCYGTKKNLKEGLQPRFIYHKIFGKTPVYLKNVIAQKEESVQQERDEIGLMQPKCKYITSEERDKLLKGLKKNWEALQKQYQGLPILTDTIPKKIRKTKMETDLKQLEKDIVLIERHPYIYVYDDDEDIP